MAYDPKLRQAMKEIDLILTKYDIGAIVALTSERHVEYKIHIEPNWSLARFVRDGEAFHLKLHHSKQPNLDWTMGMLCGFRDIAALFFSQLNEMIRRVEQHAKIDHKPLRIADIDNSDRD